MADVSLLFSMQLKFFIYFETTITVAPVILRFNKFSERFNCYSHNCHNLLRRQKSFQRPENLCTPNDCQKEIPILRKPIRIYHFSNVSSSGSGWLRVVPWGLRKLLNFIKDNYDNPPVFITENGMSDRNSSMQDGHRIYYYKHYINNVLRGYGLFTLAINSPYIFDTIPTEMRLSFSIVASSCDQSGYAVVLSIFHFNLSYSY